MILLTGITGNIGGATARALLQKGVHFRALVRDLAKAAPWAAQGVELVQGDLEDSAAVSACKPLPALCRNCTNSPRCVHLRRAAAWHCLPAPVRRRPPAIWEAATPRTACVLNPARKRHPCDRRTATGRVPDAQLRVAA